LSGEIVPTMETTLAVSALTAVNTGTAAGRRIAITITRNDRRKINAHSINRIIHEFDRFMMPSSLLARIVPNPLLGHRDRYNATLAGTLPTWP
jgi:hypothetical protein